MSDEADKKAERVGKAVADLVSRETVVKRVQLGAFMTDEDLAKERARVLAKDIDDIKR